MRWKNLPSSLESTLQSWLSPAGWKFGPPRVIALGADESWFALTEYGTFDHALNDGYETLSAAFVETGAEMIKKIEVAYITRWYVWC